MNEKMQRRAQHFENEISKKKKEKREQIKQISTDNQLHIQIENIYL